MPIPIRTVAITPYAIDAQLSRLPRLVQRLTFIYSRTFSIRIANLQYYIYVYIVCACSYMLPIELPNGFFQLTSSTVDRRPFHWWRLCSGLNFQIFQLTCLHYLRTQTQVHVCVCKLLCPLCYQLLVIRRAERADCHALCASQGGSAGPVARTLYLSFEMLLQTLQMLWLHR